MTASTPEEAAIEAAYIAEMGRLYAVLLSAIASRDGSCREAFAAGLADAISARAVALDILKRFNLCSPDAA